MSARGLRRRATALFGALLAAVALGVAGCSAPSVPSDGGADSGSADAAEAGAVTLVDGWAKAGEAGGMTGVFGTLQGGGEDLTITRVESDAAGTVELHEVTAEGVMQEIAGDVVVPARGSLELAPGANHIMLMDLTRDLRAGDEVTFTLHFDDGSHQQFTVLVKDYTGANEDYAGDEQGMDHGEHDSH